ncbi:xylose isomerase [Mesorhizobium sp. WSM1497]|nr:xylose isomerase [Mesorhizobium sp. WSM1497]
MLGCNGRGAQHLPGNPPPIDEQFRMVKESGVFDYFDRMPQPGQEKEYITAAARYDLPMITGLWTYTMGKDEALLKNNLSLTSESGGQCHNIMLFSQHADGHQLSNQEVVDFYLAAYDLAQQVGIEITFEVHINMWSEDFRRVNAVADMVGSHGIPFNFLLDHSHVLLKLDSAEEQRRSGIEAAVASGELILDPFEPDNIIDDWIARNMTVWHSVRPVAPGGPKNLWATDEHGNFGRACQYPFHRPRPGEFHSEWQAYKVEPCKAVVRRVLAHHRRDPGSRLKYVTTEIIDLIDYGMNARYSLFEQSVAIAQWIRDEWEKTATN